MKNYAKKEITVVNEVLVGVTCDICSKIIPENNYYYEVRGGHFDWGSESCESDYTNDICSDKCLTIEVNNYIKEHSGTKHLEINKKFLPYL